MTRMNDSLVGFTTNCRHTYFSWKVWWNVGPEKAFFGSDSSRS